MRLRTQIVILVGGMVLIPFLVSSMLQIFRTIGEAGREPAVNYSVTTDWIRNALPDLLARGDYSAIGAGLPAHVRMIIFGDNNQVAFSNIASFPVGATPSLAVMFGAVRRDARSFHVQWQSVEVPNDGERIILMELPHRPDERGARFRPLYAVIIISGCLLLFAIFVSAWIVRSLTRSIYRLENATRKIAGGELDFQLSAAGNNEIASLTRSFDAMRRALKDEYARRARFIMGVSHDLKTPLSLIEGYAEAIADGYANDPSTRTQYISIIREKARRLEGMVNRLIDFAKLETGEWKSLHETVKIRQFLEVIGHRYAQDAPLLKRRFRYRIEVPETALVRMDPELVERAIENLLGNAFRYAPVQTEITLAACQSDHGLTIEIHDEGPGIGEQELPFLFDPFYRGTSSRREEGTGLGLAIVKSVIESHGWMITVSSDVAGTDPVGAAAAEGTAAGSARGTTFRIVIPVP